MEYKPGVLLFFEYSGSWFNPKNFFHNIIRAYNIKQYGRSNATHTAQVVGFEEEPLVCESIGKVIITQYEQWWLDLMIKRGQLSTIYLGKPKNLELFIKMYKDTPYDWRAIFGYVLGMIGINLEYKDSTKLICSENMVVFLRMCYNIDLAKELNKDDEEISPQDIYEWFYG